MLPVQRDDVLRWKARIQAFGRDLEEAGVVVCTGGPPGLSVSVLVEGLPGAQRPWGGPGRHTGECLGGVA